MLSEEAVLSDVGLTNNEVKIYLSLLDLGHTTVTSISEKTKLHRTNVYDALKKLVDKGAVSFLKQDNIAFYEASDPNVFLYFLKEKEENLKKVLPKLLLSRKLSENLSEIISSKGVSSFLEHLNSLLKHEEEILVFGMPERAIKLLGARVFPFHKERLQKKISLKQIYPFSLKKLVKRTFDEFTKTKFCDDEDFNVSSIICNNEILITDWSSDVLTLKISSKGVSSHYKTQFNVLWSNSTK